MSIDDKIHRRTAAEWALPAWVMSIAFFVFIVIDRLVSHSMLLMNWASETASHEIAKFALGGLAISLAGFPIGYILYQVYHYIRWSSPLANDGTHIFRFGRSIELTEIFDGVDLEKMSDLDKSALRSIRDGANLDHRSAWRELIPFLKRGLDQSTMKDIFRSTERGLLDNYHMLGTSCLGAIFAYAIYILTTMRLRLIDNNPNAEISVAFIYFCFVIIAFVFIALVFDDLFDSSVFDHSPELLLTLCLLVFFGLNADTTARGFYQGAMALVVAGCVSWSVIVSRLRKRILISTMAVYLLMQIAAIRNAWSGIPTSSWAVFMNTIVLCSFMVMFLRNRNNTGKTIIYIYRSAIKSLEQP
jgi:hypothetical protein